MTHQTKLGTCTRSFLATLFAHLNLEEKKRKERENEQNRVLPSYQFAILVMLLSNNIHILFGQGSTQKWQYRS